MKTVKLHFLEVFLLFTLTIRARHKTLVRRDSEILLMALARNGESVAVISASVANLYADVDHPFSV